MQQALLRLRYGGILADGEIPEFRYPLYRDYFAARLRHQRLEASQ
jgi:hypothetical protein